MKTNKQAKLDDKVYRLPVANIEPCQLEPQRQRRAQFKPEEIESLGNSLVADGQFHPILIRPKGGNRYEIICGEQRWLASRLKNLEFINCCIRDETDSKVLILQYKENHERKQNSPLNDALTFRTVKESGNYTDEEVSAQFNVPRSEVTEKLKLNDLIEAAREELSSGQLKLRHAVYISKFPAAVQQEICDRQLAYKYYDRTEKVTDFKQFVAEIEAEILLRLDSDSTPFNVLDPRLHLKGLICPDCAERTGYSPQLFSDLVKDDSCLNRRCYKLKAETHLTLQRDAIAAKMSNPTRKPIEELAKEVPLVTERRWTDEKPFKGAKPIVNQNLLEKPECSFSELSLAVDGRMKGQQVYFCRNDECPVHHPSRVNSESAQHLEELENEFNLRVATRNRLKVLREAMNWFDDYKSFWTFDDLVKNLIVRLLMERAFASAEQILWILQRDWKNVPKLLRDENKIREFVGALGKPEQSQLLFLLTQSFDADEVETLCIAREYTNLDFFITDAETRVEFAPTEFKAQAKEYLAAVKLGEAVAPPRFWANFDEIEIVNEEMN